MKGTFTDPETEFVFTFDKSKDIVEKTNDNVKKPDGYVQVTFKTENEAKGKLDGDKLVKIYYVNPKAEIKLVELADGQTAGEKQLAVPKTAPAANYEFEKWYEEIDTTNPITSERIHVAKFKLSKVTLTYQAGEGKGTVPAAVTVDHGTTVALARPERLTKDNAAFAGWKIGETTYKAGDQVTLNKNTTAIAQWTTKEHSVSFDLAQGTLNGATSKDSVKVAHGSTLGTLEKPEREGYTFIGWKAGDEDFDPETTPVNNDVKIVAQWAKAVESIGKNDTFDQNRFIKVTFDKGAHGELYIDDAKQASPLTYKVDKTYTMDQAKAKGLVVPKVIANTYYKLLAANNGWDKALELAGQNIEFTAKYEPIADVIPVDPRVTPDNKLQDDKPEGMVLVEFKVPEDKAFMTGTTKFYVKANTDVKLDTPVVHRKTEDYIFNGWNFKANPDGTYTFTQDTVLKEGNKAKPTIGIIIPSVGDPEVSVESMTEGATGYLEVSRKGQNPVTIKADKDEYGMYFEIPQELGGELRKRDMIKVYAELDGLRSDTREYRIK